MKKYKIDVHMSAEQLAESEEEVRRNLNFSFTTGNDDNANRSDKIGYEVIIKEIK